MSGELQQQSSPRSLLDTVVYGSFFDPLASGLYFFEPRPVLQARETVPSCAVRLASLPFPSFFFFENLKPSAGAVSLHSPTQMETRTLRR